MVEKAVRQTINDFIKELKKNKGAVNFGVKPITPKELLEVIV